MEYITATITIDREYVHPVDETIAETPSVERDALLSVNVIDGGMGSVVYQLHGDRAALEAAIEDHPDVLTSTVFGEQEEVFYLFVHLQPGDPLFELMELAPRERVLLDTPMLFLADGIKARIMGTFAAIRRFCDRTPEDTPVSLDHVSEHTISIPSPLTDRQHEVVRKAFEHGYYEIPRQVTQEEIGAMLDCSPSTVDEHLRKAEARLLPLILDDDAERHDAIG